MTSVKPYFCPFLHGHSKTTLTAHAPREWTQLTPCWPFSLVDLSALLISQPVVVCLFVYFLVLAPEVICRATVLVWMHGSEWGEFNCLDWFVTSGQNANDHLTKTHIHLVKFFTVPSCLPLTCILVVCVQNIIGLLCSLKISPLPPSSSFSLFLISILLPLILFFLLFPLLLPFSVCLSIPTPAGI